MDHVDRIVDLAEKCDTQVILDLHGNPGGESSEAPCGRKNADWRESCWRRGESLRILEQIARRYANRHCIAGIQVCNEPDARCKMSSLCDWYEQAINTIRAAGMNHGQVAVIVPVYWYDRLQEFVDCWASRGHFLRHENVVLDLHLYQCFGRGWEGLDHHEHLEVSRRHGAILQSIPASMVGEWSLARPAHVLATDAMELEFAKVQLDSYAGASHGWFFWNFRDQADHWDLETCFERGWLPDLLTHSDATTRPRIHPPGRFPMCYGPQEFSSLPDHGRSCDPAAVESQVSMLAEATGRAPSEAFEALKLSSGNTELAVVRLFQLATAEKLAGVTGRTVEDAQKALELCGGSEMNAACHLLDEHEPAAATTRKRPREEDHGL
eukprot:TRINITY_DN4611_c0_g1_i1.p1 TRINITY_DN4611_c0_g1~~TRINITY_DN4611_c0_g1_i1.p1  ORF type:complete len:418 (+),score=58.76 TRINITY_DN4611_c0_g1_i1:114-1256(+)